MLRGKRDLKYRYIQTRKQDLQQKKGCCVVDPHGDLVEDVLGWIPRSRADDVIMRDSLLGRKFLTLVLRLN